MSKGVKTPARPFLFVRATRRHLRFECLGRSPPRTPQHTHSAGFLPFQRCVSIPVSAALCLHKRKNNQPNGE